MSISINKYMRLFVGLGNPGKKYEKTRHNIGFLFLDWIKNSEKVESKWKKKFAGVFCEWNMQTSKIVFLKPETYMNLSGTSVQKASHFYKLDPREIILLTDDVDMDFGKVRYRSSGSAWGHNGIADIIQKLGTSDIARIKIGIGRHDHMDTSDWVLSNLTNDELQELYDDIFPKAFSLLKESFLGSK